MLHCMHALSMENRIRLKGPALFLMLFARWAKRSVLRVSAKLALAGLMLATMIVFELPPRESCVNRTDPSKTTYVEHAQSMSTMALAIAVIIVMGQRYVCCCTSPMGWGACALLANNSTVPAV